LTVEQRHIRVLSFEVQRQSREGTIYSNGVNPDSPAAIARWPNQALEKCAHAMFVAVPRTIGEHQVAISIGISRCDAWLGIG
jgi:hypothetical protein